MKKDKAKKIAIKSILGFACFAATFGIFSNVSLSRAGASGGARTVASYFQTSEGVEITANADTPSYVIEKRNGVLVESVEGGTVVYDNLIDMTDLTKDDLLFEVQWTPKSLGDYEFNQLVVRLEDSVDSKNYVEISLLRYPFNDVTNRKATVVAVKTNTITEYKSVKNTLTKSSSAAEGTNPYSSVASVKTGTNQGRVVYGSFLGSNGTMSDPVSIYYDNEECAIYTKNLNIWPRQSDEAKDPTDSAYRKAAIQRTGKVDGNGKAIVLDMDDHAHMGTQKSNLWTGFPSGKAKLTMRTFELVKDTASYTLLTLNNQTLDGTLINDKTAPELNVDLSGYSESKLPNAQVGKYYPFFSARATDIMYGEVEVEKRVYKDGEELYCSDDGFIPSQSGEYQVDYVAYDGSGNKTVKSLYVTAKNRLSGIDYELLENDSVFPLWGERRIDLYYPVKLPEMTATSDGGKVHVDKKVYHNGNKIAITSNSFRPERLGEYEVVYTLTDYVGNVEKVTYTLQAEYSEIPLLEKPNLPKYLVVGKAYKFPAVQSQFYALWQQPLKTYDVITLKKGNSVIKTFKNGEIAAYTPTQEEIGELTIEYSTATSETATPVVYTQAVTVLPFENLTDLFVLGDGVTMTPSSSDLQFFFTGENQKVEFVNPVSVYGELEISFNVPVEANNFAAVKFIIRDELNADNYIEITIEKAAVSGTTLPTISYLSVNGGEQKELKDASFYGNTKSNFIFSVAKDGSVYDNDDNMLAKAENFEGFTSGFVCLEFEVIGVEGESAIALKNINNQKIRENDKDRVKPLLTVFEEPKGQVELNEKVYVSGAVASDVFDGNAKITVTLTLNDKELFRAEDAFGEFTGAYFQPTEYGTYIVTYYAKDGAGNDLTKVCNIVVRDLIAPVIQIQGELPKTGKVGKALELPKAIATDNADWDLQVYVIVINPMNTFTLLPVGEKYIPTYEGRHIVKYYCEDKNYNTTYSQDYTVTVNK